MIERMGSEWGGFWVDLDLVPAGSTAICAGIGNDITFDLGLISSRQCHVVGLDPTQRAREHIEAQRKAGAITEATYTYLPRALYGEPGIELTCHSFRSIWRQGGDASVSITLPELFAQYPDTSLVKLDIEGSEYPVLDALGSVPVGVKQLCIEFHHRMPEVPFEHKDTERVVHKLLAWGFSMTKCEKDYEDTLFTRS